jgi:hypothetical protein
MTGKNHGIQRRAGGFSKSQKKQRFKLTCTPSEGFLKETRLTLVQTRNDTIFDPMNFPCAAFSSLILLASPALHAQQPSPQAILEGARMGATLTHLPEGLKGNLTSGGRRVPVEVHLKGKEGIQFQFLENNRWEIFHMRHREGGADLLEMRNQAFAPFPNAKIIQPIAGTDLTFEDLSMRFLYWSDPVLEGMENVGRDACYKLRLTKPKGSAGRYETVHLWVHAKFGAFMRVRGYNAAGGILKEFQVEDVMQVGPGTWTLRKMQVATHDPASGRRTSLTNVTFDDPTQKPLRRGGLR